MNKKRFLSIAVTIALFVGIFPQNALCVAFSSNKKLLSITEFEDVYVDEDGKYYMTIESELETDRASSNIEIDQEKLILVEKTSAQFCDAISMSGLIRDNDLPIEIKNDISTHYQAELSSRCPSKAIVTVFKPIENNRGTSYYTYQGYSMKRYTVTYTGLNTGYQTIYSGNSTKVNADSLITLILTVATSPLIGTSNVTVGFVAAGYSLLSLFINHYGANFVTGSTNDHVQLRMIYNCVNKYTYVYSNSLENWQMGHFGQKVTLTQINFSQYYYNTNTLTGHTWDSNMSNLSLVLQSNNYNNSDATAVQYMFLGLYEDVTAKFGSKTYMF